MFEIDDAEIINETEKAVLVDAPIFDEPQWVPKSQVHEDSSVYEATDSGTIIVKDWWAEKQGWD
jgi:hypothetical protein